MSDQDFNPHKEWVIPGTLAISKIDDKPVNIPVSKGQHFFFEISVDPNDVENKLMRLKTNEKGNHIEIIFNYERFSDAIFQAQLRQKKSDSNL